MLNDIIRLLEESDFKVFNTLQDQMKTNPGAIEVLYDDLIEALHDDLEEHDESNGG